ncbi:hypothetical protein GCM10020367_55390 [Streptomyces sannanensis]|uniref:OmpR/PhoB-type domain-containing protein n=1 Tax=Streptomyces sannanensis TaxID=285536 RepID=A0ABP6SJV1_9ACTN
MAEVLSGGRMSGIPDGSGVELGVLGPLSIRVCGGSVEIPGRRERQLLAVLTAARGTAVSADRLVDELWDGDPPPTATSGLQVCVSRLRALLEPGRRPRTASSVIITTDGGYELRIPGHAVDADRFTATVERATWLAADGDPATALTDVEAGLAEWRGRAYGDLGDLPTVREEADRLAELRLLACEARLDALLALGRHTAVVPDAELLVRQNPFRERFTNLLVRALCGSGRQADALAALRRTQVQLADELGVDPSPVLRALERDVLDQAPHLFGPAITHTSPAPVRPPVTERTAAPIPAPAPVDPVSIIGRRPQLAALDDALADTAAGGGTMALISGEPGIGKTALAAELARRADALGMRTVWGRCHEGDAAPAFWPWTAVVRATLDPGEPIPRELLPLLPESSAQASARGTDFDPTSSSLRVYEAVVRLLARASARTPLVVILDDIHWADASSLHLLGYAAEALAVHPVLIAATARDAEPDGDAALDSCLASLARSHPVRLPLTGLDRDETRELLQRTVGTGIDTSTADAVHDRADGNPFYARELARLLGTDPAVAGDLDRADIPIGVRCVVRRRLTRLPETTLTCCASPPSSAASSGSTCSRTWSRPGSTNSSTPSMSRSPAASWTNAPRPRVSTGSSTHSSVKPCTRTSAARAAAACTATSARRWSSGRPRSPNSPRPPTRWPTTWRSACRCARRSPGPRCATGSSPRAAPPNGCCVRRRVRSLTSSNRPEGRGFSVCGWSS